MKQIRLSNSPYFALCDDKDFTLLSRLTWRLWKGDRSRNVYAITELDGTSVYMHQLVYPSEIPGLMRDHINGNGLDNQSANIRFATRSQNQANRRKVEGSSSKYKGVCKKGFGWSGEIKVNGIRYRKTFQDELKAARWYNMMATKHFGEFAKLSMLPVVAIPT